MAGSSGEPFRNKWATNRTNARFVAYSRSRPVARSSCALKCAGRCGTSTPMHQSMREFGEHRHSHEPGLDPPARTEAADAAEAEGCLLSHLGAGDVHTSPGRAETDPLGTAVRGPTRGCNWAARRRARVEVAKMAPLSGLVCHPRRVLHEASRSRASLEVIWGVRPDRTRRGHPARRCGRWAAEGGGRAVRARGRCTRATEEPAKDTPKAKATIPSHLRLHMFRT